MSEELPSKLQMGLNILKAGGRAAKYVVTEGKLPISPEELSKERLAICETCPLLVTKGDRKTCKSCGCILMYKTRTLTEKCPKGKW